MVSNITPGISSKLGKNLHNQKNHPLEIIKRKIYNYFGDKFNKFDDLSPIVKVEENFDKLLIPKDHPARSVSDTYYKDENHVLRTHTSAHQNDLLIAGNNKFLVTGDVYRKDDIDASHYPVFHQMEGVSVMEDGQNAEEELKKVLSGLIDVLFPGCEYRFNEDYFPFTHPSFEVEVMFQGRWLEVLGCGIVQPKIMENCGLSGKTAWAFGLGLERLAMILFKIPDIRYFWSDDERFKNQFVTDEIIEFKPYSSYPPITRDIAFWVPEGFSQNNFSEIVRETGGDLVENVSVVDEFTHPKTNRSSKCYRIVYRSNERTLTNEEVNEIDETIKNASIEKLSIEIR
jgi:phenylalanyl-tRNA synthetase alpha chain